MADVHSNPAGGSGAASSRQSPRIEANFLLDTLSDAANKRIEQLVNKSLHDELAKLPANAAIGTLPRRIILGRISPGEVKIDSSNLGEVGLDAAAKARVEDVTKAAIRDIGAAVQAELARQPVVEKPKVDVTVKGTYTEKGGAGAEVSVTLHF